MPLGHIGAHVLSVRGRRNGTLSQLMKGGHRWVGQGSPEAFENVVRSQHSKSKALMVEQKGVGTEVDDYGQVFRKKLKSK
jgi:hypothetical protein